MLGSGRILIKRTILMIFSAIIITKINMIKKNSRPISTPNHNLTYNPSSTTLKTTFSSHRQGKLATKISRKIETFTTQIQIFINLVNITLTRIRNFRIIRQGVGALVMIV